MVPSDLALQVLHADKIDKAKSSEYELESGTCIPNFTWTCTLACIMMKKELGSLKAAVAAAAAAGNRWAPPRFMGMA